MNIAIFGYGKMGREIEKLAEEKNHNVVLRVDENNIDTVTENDFTNVDVAIEFSTPESAFRNINLCLDNNIPCVCGTTGWLDRLEKVVKRCESENKTFFYASNYSIGVNLFFKLNSHLAELMNKFPAYKIEIEETHHTQKLDAPSGTAITLADGIIEKHTGIKSWEKEQTNSESIIPVKSFREGSIPGNHKVIYESTFDKITIEHDAKNRKGFALGAIMAAEFILSKNGYYTMNELLKINI